MTYYDPFWQCADYLSKNGVKGVFGFSNGAFHVGLFGDEPEPDIHLWCGIPIYYDRHICCADRKSIEDDWDDEP